MPVRGWALAVGQHATGEQVVHQAGLDLLVFGDQGFGFSMAVSMPVRMVAIFFCFGQPGCRDLQQLRLWIQSRRGRPGDASLNFVSRLGSSTQ